MKTLHWSMAISLLFLTAACVTINVYFPAAVAERVADKFVQDVYGPADQTPPASQPNGETGPQSLWNGPQQLLINLAQFVIPAAHAQADFDASSPAIQSIKASLQERHQQLEPHYNSGAIGMTNNGEITVRDLAAVPLPKRNAVRKLVADENAERAALYREIATANDHPEWEPEIRQVFSKRWVSNARSGWAYQNEDGDWNTK